MSHVFISYSHKDKLYVHKLKKALEDVGFEVWIDDRIAHGTTWPMVIQRNLDACSAFIVVMTESAFDSKWVHNEVTRAERKGKPFFALLLSGDTWLSFEAVQYENVTGGRLPSQKFYDGLAGVAPRKTKEPLPPPRPPLFRRIFTTLKPLFFSARPIFKFTGWIAVVAAFLWGGSFVISQLPPPTPTSEPTATTSFATQELVEQVMGTETATPRPTIVPPENILLQENFAGNAAQAWNADKWKVAKELNGNSYWWSWTGPNTYSYAWYAGNVSGWSDYVFESQVQLFPGSSLSICVRTDEEGACYAVTLRDNAVKSSQYVLSSASQSRALNERYSRYFDDDGWHIIRIEIRDDIMTTYVNGNLVLRDVLPEPLLRTEGGVGFIAEGKVYVDEIRIWKLK